MRALRVALASGLGLALMGGTGAAQEAGDTGTVAGRVVVCRSALRQTVADNPQASGDLRSLVTIRRAAGSVGGAQPAVDNAADPAGAGFAVDADAAVGDKLTPVDAEVPGGQDGAAGAQAAQPAPLDPNAPLQPRGRFVPPLLAVPVANALITVPGTDLAATTDATGRFEIGGVPAATPVTLQAELPATRPLLLPTPEVVVGAGETVDVGTLTLSNCLATFTPNPVAPTDDLAQ